MTADTAGERTLNHYEARQEARRDQLLRRAEKFEAAARAADDQARRMADVIPLGQPILVGHHSEGRDRRYRARIHMRWQRAREFAETAARLRDRAAGMGKTGISSDDPDAIDKLREKLARLTASQAKMVAANRLVRKEDRDGLRAMGFTEEQVSALFTPDFAGRLGFPDYLTRNNGANIRRIEQRIASLERNQGREEKTETGPGYTYREDPEENRVLLRFDRKPEVSIIRALRSEGFKWSPTRGAWLRQLNGSAIWAARRVRDLIDRDVHTQEGSA